MSLVTLQQLRQFLSKQFDGNPPSDAFLEGLIREIDGQVILKCSPALKTEGNIFRKKPFRVFNTMNEISEKARHIFGKCNVVSNSSIFRYTKTIQYSSMPKFQAIFLWGEAVFGTRQERDPVAVPPPILGILDKVVSENLLQQVFIEDIDQAVPKSKADQKCRWVTWADGLTFTRDLNFSVDDVSMPALTASDLLTFFTGLHVIWSAFVDSYWVLAGPSLAMVITTSKGE